MANTLYIGQISQ